MADVTRTKLSEDLRGIAATQLLAIYDEASKGRESLLKLEQKVEEKANGVVFPHLILIAAGAHNNANGDGDKIARLFKQMCAHGEGVVKKERKVDNFQDVLPTYAVYKSEIKKALRLGMNPNETDDNDAPKYQVIGDVRGFNRLHLATSDGTGARPPGSQSPAGDAAEAQKRLEAAAPSVYGDIVGAAMNRLLKALKAGNFREETPEVQQAACDILETATTAILELAGEETEKSTEQEAKAGVAGA